jgi:hypothetical protein
LEPSLELGRDLSQGATRPFFAQELLGQLRGFGALREPGQLPGSDCQRSYIIQQIMSVYVCYLHGKMEVKKKALIASGVRGWPAAAGRARLQPCRQTSNSIQAPQSLPRAKPKGDQRSHPATPNHLDSHQPPEYCSPSPRCRAPKSSPRKSFRDPESRRPHETCARCCPLHRNSHRGVRRR